MHSTPWQICCCLLATRTDPTVTCSPQILCFEQLWPSPPCVRPTILSFWGFLIASSDNWRAEMTPLMYGWWQGGGDARTMRAIVAAAVMRLSCDLMDLCYTKFNMGILHGRWGGNTGLCILCTFHTIGTPCFQRVGHSCTVQTMYDTSSMVLCFRRY